MKHDVLVLLFFLLLVCPVSAQNEGSPQSRPSSRPATTTQDTGGRSRQFLLKRDLIIPPMKNVVDAGDGIRWSLLRRAKKKRRHLRRGDRVKAHMTFWDQKTGKELMTSRRRGDHSPHGLSQLNVGVNFAALDRVLLQMRVGDKVRIDAPSRMAFGEVGVPKIPGNTDIIIALEVHGIVKHVDIPEPLKWDEKKATRINKRAEYYLVKEGTGPVAGDSGIVVYDYLYSSIYGDVFDYSRLRDYAVIGGQAGNMKSEFMRAFSPVAKKGSEFFVKVDLTDVPRHRHPFALRGSPYLMMHLFTRWVIPFNPSTEEMKTTDSGLKYQIIEPGEGPEIKDTHHVVVHYAWWTREGKLVESSFARGTTNTLRQVALPRGMVEGLHLLRPGGRIRLYVPSRLAFGMKGRKDVEPGMDVIMYLELKKSVQLDPLPKKKVKKPEAPPSKPGGK